MTAADAIAVVILAVAVFLLLFGEPIACWLEHRRDHTPED